MTTRRSQSLFLPTDFIELVVSNEYESSADFEQNLDEWMREGRGFRRFFNPRVARQIPQQLVDSALWCMVRMEPSETCKKIHMLVNRFGADVNHHQNGNPELPNVLCEAIDMENIDAVTGLVECGANLNPVCKSLRINHFCNVLTSAAESNCIKIFEKLTEYGCDLRQTDRQLHGDRPFYAAIKGGHFKLVHFLLEMGADANGRNYEAKTPLHIAINSLEADGPRIVDLLLTCGADPQLRCHAPFMTRYGYKGNGFTPLQLLLSPIYGPKRNSTTPYTFEQEMASCTNQFMLEDRMTEQVGDWRLALFMSTHDRLGGDPKCSISALAGEPDLLKMIMNNVTGCRDEETDHIPNVPAHELEDYLPGDVTLHMFF
jgi:hypothetical protein